MTIVAGRKIKRRDLLVGTLTFAAGNIITGVQTAMSETYNSQAFDLQSLIKRWPEGRQVPQLILDVAAYVGDKPWGSLGYTRITGARPNDNWILNGADMWPHFGYFIGFADGTEIGQWFREGAASSNGPIVRIGSEGDLRIVVETVEELFARWALSGTIVHGVEVNVPGDMFFSPYNPSKALDGRPGLQAFLQQRLGGDLTALIKPEADSAPLEAFFQKWEADQRAKTLADPTMQAIARLLNGYIPRGKEPWARTWIAIQVAGDRIEFKGPLFDADHKSLPFAEEAALIPLVMKAREDRAQGIHAPRGLWHQATLILNADGLCHFAADWDPPWDNQPQFKDGSRPTAAEIASDLKRYPRSAGWMEPWMTLK